jgi:hypothetical protein
MKKTNTKWIGAVLLVVFAMWRLFVVLSPKTAPKEAFEAYNKLGALAATETAKLLGSGAEVILVVPAEVSKHVKSGENTFVNTAVKAGLKVKEILRAPEGSWHVEQGMSATYYEQVMQQAAGTAAVVSYVGIPNRAVLRTAVPDPKAAAFVAVLPHERFLPDLMKAGRVQLAIVPTGPPQNFRAVSPEVIVEDIPAEGAPMQDEPEFIDDILTPR